MSASAVSAKSAAAPVNTAKIAGRRELRFNNFNEVQADAERLAAVAVHQLGNWSVGQATAHLARTMKMSLDGDPRRAPLPIRILARLMKRRMLTKGMQPGFKLPKQAAELYIATPEISTEQGLSELRTAINRMKTEPQRHPHPAFGTMTTQEWEQLHLRHAELHLSFFVPA